MCSLEGESLTLKVRILLFKLESFFLLLQSACCIYPKAVQLIKVYFRF